MGSVGEIRKRLDEEYDELSKLRKEMEKAREEMMKTEDIERFLDLIEIENIFDSAAEIVIQMKAKKPLVSVSAFPRTDGIAISLLAEDDP